MPDKIYKNQHFLINPDIAKDMVFFAEVESKDHILEIGPGKGFLTKYLAEFAKKVTVIEKDSHLKDDLQEIKNKFSNIEIVMGNALSSKWPKGIDKIVSNIPFNITEPLFNRLYSERFKSATLLVGEKQANNIESYQERILPDTTPISRLAILTNAFFDTEYLMKIPSNSFNPEPSVNGALISIKPRKKSTARFEDYIFRSIWEQRKRPLGDSLTNSVINYLSIGGEICYLGKERILDLFNLPKELSGRRGTELVNPDFMRLYECLSNKKAKKKIFKTNRNLSNK